MYDKKTKEFPTVWKYNMREHFTCHHPGYTLTDSQLPMDFQQALQLSKEEQQALCIPDNLVVVFNNGDGQEANSLGKRKCANSRTDHRI
jgi:hypothetical protein